ncbi:exported hypothetical protein [Acidobacteriia bacterium SbA2]|nr:exported hypothetical protein [Acidobacteriia bacterium SbA2]
MRNTLPRGNLRLCGWIVICALSLPAAISARTSDVMGEVRFSGQSGVEKSSGVWVDGQYVGYLKELKGSKKLLLLPGEHLLTVRQDGYQDFIQKVQIEPHEVMCVHVVMAKAASAKYPDVTATVKVDVKPARAAVFVDGLFVGHVGEFQGMGRGMLVAPGSHEIKIALPGYQTFETQIKPLANQTVEIKTDLQSSEGSPSGPLLNSESSAATPKT